MKRKVLALIMLFLFVGLVGCAKTQISDVFRFEVRELEMTLYADEAKNVEKELGLIKGAIDEDAAIVYSMSYVDGKNAGQVCYINDILEIISVEDYIDDGGIVAGTIISDSNTKVKVKAKGEGTIRLTAFLKDSPNVTDSILITVQKEILEGIKISAPKDVVYFGQTMQLTVETFPKHIDSEFNFKSSNKGFLTVDKNGLVTGVVQGEQSTETSKEITITATAVYDSSVSATYKLTVTYEKATGIKVKNGENEIKADETVKMIRNDEIQLSVEVLSELGFANKKVTYKSSDTKVATISNAGLIKAVNGGTSTITVATADGSVSFAFKVEVGYNPSTSAEIKFNDEVVEEQVFEVALNKNYNFTAKVEPFESANQNVKVEVADEYKEFVKIDGLKITPLKVGEFKLTVSTLDETNPVVKEVSFKVDYDDVASVEITSKPKELVVGSEYQVTAKVSPTGAVQDVIYTSSDDTIATVDESGLVKALAKGTVTITVTSVADGEKKATIELNVYDKAESFTVSGITEGQKVVLGEDLVITVTITPETAYVEKINVELENDLFDISSDGLKITLSSAEAGTEKITISIDGLAEQVFNVEVVEEAE